MIEEKTTQTNKPKVLLETYNIVGNIKKAKVYYDYETAYQDSLLFDDYFTVLVSYPRFLEETKTFVNAVEVRANNWPIGFLHISYEE